MMVVWWKWEKWDHKRDFLKVKSIGLGSGLDLGAKRGSQRA